MKQNNTNSSYKYQNIRKIFGNLWLENSIKNFYQKRSKISEKNIYNPEIQNLEKHTHPLIREIIGQLTISENIVDLSLLNTECKAYLDLILLDRDLGLLLTEIEQNDQIFNDYKNGLTDENSFDQRRFEIFVAANFKLNEFNVKFIPTQSKNSLKTYEFDVTKEDSVSFEVECKQRYQRAPDYEREKFLYLLTANLFPRLLGFGVKNILIEVNWKGSVEFQDIKKISDFIVSKLIGITGFSKNSFGKYELIFRNYLFQSSLPKSLNQLQRNVPNYITTADAYLSTHKGLFLSINRDIELSTIKRLRSLYRKAKNQFGSTNNRLIYIDIGTLPIEAIEIFDNSLRKKPPKDVGMLIILKHQLHINGNREIIFTPNTQLVWNRKLIPPCPIINQIPGFIGESGFDTYIQVVLPNPN